VINMFKTFIFLSVAMVIAGCGVAHVKSDTPKVDVSKYSAAKIGEVKVYSLEKNAASNAPLQKKLANWQQEAIEKLGKAISMTPLRLAAEASPPSDNTLVFSIDSNVRYGNRALRWAVGFGAGKGGVVSVLTVTDEMTGSLVYRATAESDLAVGGAGGDMGSVFRKNIDKLLAEYLEA